MVEKHFAFQNKFRSDAARPETRVKFLRHLASERNIDTVAYDRSPHRDNMSTVKRRRGESLHLELPKDGGEDKPPTEALFLIQFDARKG